MTHRHQSLDPQRIRGYHAHVYFASEAERVHAARLREQVAERFPVVVVGRWHYQPVGPHSQPMYQLAFAVDQLPLVLPWLLLNQSGLSILLHPSTGNGYADHVRHAAWLGRPLPLRLDVLRRATGRTDDAGGD